MVARTMRCCALLFILNMAAATETFEVKSSPAHTGKEELATHFEDELLEETPGGDALDRALFADEKGGKKAKKGKKGKGAPKTPGKTPSAQPTVIGKPLVNPPVQPQPLVNPAVQPGKKGKNGGGKKAKGGGKKAKASRLSPLPIGTPAPTPPPGPVRPDLGVAWTEAANCSNQIGGLGTTVQLDEFGYLMVAEICCNFQMEFFITRVIISMGYKVCDQSGIMGMVPWFSCGDFQSLEKMKISIRAGMPSKTECPFVQWNNEQCPGLAPSCFPNKTDNKGYHRRRVCDQVGGYSGGGPDPMPVEITKKNAYATPSPGKNTVINLGGPAKNGGKKTNVINVPGYGDGFTGFSPMPAPAPPAKVCMATFMNMAGTTVMNTMVQGENDYDLDLACCMKCSQEEECTFWVRKSGVAPGTACYLRKLAKGISNSLAYRGGWRKEMACGGNNKCFSAFDYMSGTIIDKVGICGKSAEDLDQACCAKCRKHEECEFWVRERGDTGYRACQLMKNPGAPSVNILYRGGWRQGCGKFEDCHATFLNRGGSLIDKLGVCGDNHIALDAACCDLCAKNEDCEFWSRESGSIGTQFCWIYKNAAFAESHSSNRRSGWNKICNSGNGYDQCLATFQTINGATVMTTRVCGKDDAGLDTECCQKCKANNLCESWVRERGTKGFKTCWLKRASTTESNNANHRGGYTTKRTCGDAYQNNGCRASFYEWGGPQVGKIRYVCGKNAVELDAHCCALCRNETLCDFWVREAIGSTAGEGANRPRACWLRRAMGGPSKNLARRGGFKQGCGKPVPKSKQTFMDRSGAQINRVAVCGPPTMKTKAKMEAYLDDACGDLCAKTDLCEFWVRDRIPFTVAHGAPNTTYCWLRKNAAINPANNANRRGGWNRICGSDNYTPCGASFQEMHGHVVATERVCGKSDEQLDAECCAKCKDMTTCDFWIREKGSRGYLWCWLRRKGNGNKSPNANRRGGYKTPSVCGKEFVGNKCKSDFDEMSGAQLKIEFVCGANDKQLDAHCCALCRNDTRCEFWVRETRLITDPPTRPKMCWLRWNAGSASKNANRRGGWREGCDNRAQKCLSTFTDRSGPEVDKRGVCGNGTKQKGLDMDEYLDSACCEMCAQNPLCEFWVRETTLPARNNTFCYLRKHGALTETVRTNKRGGWNKICGDPNNPKCGAVFQEIHSSQVAVFRVCGRTDAQLDAECCKKCKDNNLCEKWVRETGKEGWRWCWLRRAGNNQRRAHNTRRGGWKEDGKCGKDYVSNGCKSAFDHIGGSQVGYDFICGETEEQLDAHCCALCRNNTRCEFWVRQSGDSGIKQCWLRMNPGGHSKNAGYRGGWRQGCGARGLAKCDATFTDWNGPEVDRLGVCGDNDAQMDAACCALCEKEPLCEFWVREDTEKVTEDRKGSALCWLRKAGSTERVATDKRGGWKTCPTDGEGVGATATFQEMSGPQVAAERVCGANDALLDGSCSAKCDKNPSCMFWVREAGNAGYKWCWLRRHPGGASNNNNRRGGFKKRDTPKCDGTFGDMSGPQVTALTVYGGTDAELDAECCEACRKQMHCQFWVRDYRRTFPSNIGGKTCWLRWHPNLNSKSATHPHRRGGMKPQSLLQEEADSVDNFNEHDEDAVDEADPELSLLQSAEGSRTKDKAWTASNASAEVNELEEQQQVELQAKADAEAQAKADADEEAANQAKIDQEMKVARESTEHSKHEELFHGFNSDIPSRIHESGHRAAMDERGYEAVAGLKSDAEMEAYVRRACRFMGFTVMEDAKLQGIVPYYSGVQAKQSFENLLLELERAAHDANGEKWLMTDDEAFAIREADEKVADEQEGM